MNRKLSLYLILVVLVLAVTSACVGEDTKERMKDAKENEIEVLVPDYGNNYEGYDITEHLRYAGMLYTNKTGVPVRFTTLESGSVSEYLKARSFKMLSEDAPEIIITDTTDTTLYSLFSNDALLPIRDRLTNADAIYPGLSTDKIIPIGMQFPTYGINTSLLEERGLDIPEIDWTLDEYLDLYSKTLDVKPVRLNGILLRDFLAMPLYQDPLLDYENGQVLLTEDRFNQMVDSLAAEFRSPRYITNSRYTHTTYYTMAMGLEKGWDWYLFNMNREDHLLNVLTFNNHNLLNSRSLNVEFYIAGMKVMYSPRPNRGMYVAGMTVNRRSQNIDEAVDFIDFYLSKDIQWTSFEKKGIYSLDLVRNDMEAEMAEFYSAYPLNDKTNHIRDLLYEELNAGKYVAEWKIEKDQDVTRSEILQPIFELAYGNDYKNKTQREKTFNKIMNQLRLQAIE